LASFFYRTRVVLSMLVVINCFDLGICYGSIIVLPDVIIDFIIKGF